MTSAIASAMMQSSPTNPMGALFSGPIIGLAVVIALVGIVAGWKVFEKAGQPGWAVLIPIFNAYIILKIVGRPAWWLLLMLIPVVNVLISAIVAIDVAKSFGQSAAFGIVLLFLLCGIGYLILGFGSARYIGPAAAMPQYGAA
jgi:Ca2+/Na+ antiporter